MMDAVNNTNIDAPADAQSADTVVTPAAAPVKAKSAAGKAFDAPHLHLSTSPHVRSPLTVRTVMLIIIAALIPSFVSSLIYFGLSAFALTAVCIGAAVGTEGIANRMLKRKQSIGDMSAVLTGLLVAFNLPPSLPLWMAALGSIFAIAVAKMFFGGLGSNIVNPALAGRAFLFISYPAPMTSFSAPNFGSINGLADGISSATSSVASSVDAISSATPLGAIKYAFADGSFAAADYAAALKGLFIGNVGGCIGETSALALLAGGIFLAIVKTIDFRIPLSYILTTFFLFWLTNGTHTYFTVESLITPTFHILAGGLFLGAFFMATDPVTSPITPKGRVVFGMGCGLLTFVIRKYGGYPEGVSFSILLMNLVVPLIERCTRPTIYGEVKKRG